MKLLLDTHTFLWFIDGHASLSTTARALIEDPDHMRWVSAASLWEMAIKASLGRLALKLSFTDLVEQHIIGNAMAVLPLRATHLDEVTQLPYYHRDPFDRLIVAQGIVEGMIVLSKDTAFASYPVDVRW